MLQELTSIFLLWQKYFTICGKVSNEKQVSSFTANYDKNLTLGHRHCHFKGVFVQLTPKLKFDDHTLKFNIPLVHN